MAKDITDGNSSHLPDPANNHRPGLRALLQRVVLQQHVVPGVARPELVVPEEIPDDVRRCVLEDGATAVLGRAILENETRRPTS